MKYDHLSISGMNCQHCVMALKKELSKIDGLTIRDVAIGSADVEYDEARVSPTMVDTAVREAGFERIPS